MRTAARQSNRGAINNTSQVTFQRASRSAHATARRCVPRPCATAPDPAAAYTKVDPSGALAATSSSRSGHRACVQEGKMPRP